MNLKKLNLQLLLPKGGKHRNALSYHPGFNTESVPSLPSPLIGTVPVISRGGKREGSSWLEEQQLRDEKVVIASNARVLSHYQLVFEKYDALISPLLMDMAFSAHWNRWSVSTEKLPHIFKKNGQEINGWGWVVYRIHSSGEALLPETPEPSNYTLFNFWQVTFTNGCHSDLSPDLRLWHLHAKDTLQDFERLMPGQVEKWLKEQLFAMHKTGCLWVALPDLLNEKGKRRKPTIQDALHAYNVLSYGRNYDEYQTEAHFYDRPPYNNQFIQGHFKR